MEIFSAILSFLSDISWPVSAFGMLYLTLHAVKNRWIDTLKAWHKDSGVLIGRAPETLVAEVQKIKNLDESEAEDLRTRFRKVLSGEFGLQRGSGPNGDFWGYPNGMRSAQIKIKFDGSQQKLTQTFPCVFNTDCLQVTFAGDVQPEIKRLSSTTIELEVPPHSKGTVTMSVFGL